MLLHESKILLLLLSSILSYYEPHFIYLLTGGRPSGWFPVFDNYEHSWYKYSCTGFCVNISFHFSWVNARIGIGGSYGKYILNFIGNCQAAFVPKWLYILHSHQQYTRVSPYLLRTWCSQGFCLPFFFLNYLFIWLRQVLVVACGIFIAACGIFRCGTWALVAACGLLSSCGTRALEHVGSVVAAHGLSSCGLWAPEHAGSVVAARGLSSCGTWALECTGLVLRSLGLVALQHVGS